MVVDRIGTAVETEEIRGTTLWTSASKGGRGLRTVQAKLHNGTNKTLSVIMQKTTKDDSTFAKAISTTAADLTAGATTAIVSDGEAYELYRVTAQASVAPTTGALEVVWSAKHGSD